MASRFPIVRQDLTVSGRGPSVRADIDVRTGEGAVGAAIGQAAIAGLGLGIRYNAMQGKAQADTAERDARLSMVQFLNEIRLKDDVSKWDTAFQAHKERVAALTPENRSGARQYNSAINNLVPVWQQRFTDLKAAKLEDNMIAASIVKRNDLMNAATIDTMPQVIQKIKTELEVLDRLSPTISRVETEIAKARVERDVQLSIAKGMALSNPEVTLASIEEGKIAGFDALTVDDILRVRNIANSTITQVARDNVEQQEADRAVINRTLFVDKNYDIFDLVEASSLDGKEKLSFYKLARTLAAAPPEGYKDNPVLMAKILPLIARGKLTEPQIRSYVGKGLSPETAESVIKGEYFWKDYWFKEADDFLKRNLGWSSRDEVFMHPEGSVAYDAALRELRTIVLTEKLKGREIIEKARDIGLPYLTDYWREVLTMEETLILKMTEMIRGEKKAEIPAIEEKPILEPSITLDDIWGK